MREETETLYDYLLVAEIGQVKIFVEVHAPNASKAKMLAEEMTGDEDMPLIYSTMRSVYTGKIPWSEWQVEDCRDL